MYQMQIVIVLLEYKVEGVDSPVPYLFPVFVFVFWSVSIQRGTCFLFVHYVHQLFILWNICSVFPGCGD